MTSIERVYIPEKAVLWPAAGVDNYGIPQVTSPQEIDVEWPRGFSESNSNQDSKESSSDTVVTDFDVALGSLLWYGAYIDLPAGTANPSPIYQVVSRNIAPDIKGRSYRYTLTVTRYSNTLPSLV